MNQAVLAGKHFHERAEGGRGNNLAGVQFTDFNGLEHAGDQFQRTVQAFLLGGVDVHGAVFLNVDVGAGFSLDGLDVLAAGANQLANAVGGNLGGLNAGSIRAHLGRSRNGVIHDFQHVRASGLRHVDGFFQNGEGDAGQLEVQLVARHAFRRAAKLEVHVTVEVFGTDDVQKGLVRGDFMLVILFRHQAHGNARHGALEGHAGRQQGHRARADGSHGGGTVGFHDFRRNADGVREFLFTRDNRSDGTFRQGAMADFTTVLTAETTGIAHGEGREVVVQDEALFIHAARVVVHVLAFFHRSERRQAEGHGFTAGKHRGAVHHGGQHVDFRGQGAQFLEGAAVGALVLVHDGDAEGLLLNVFKDLFHVKIGSFRMAFLDGGFHFVAQGSHLLLAFHLGGGIDGVFNAVTGDFIADFQQFRLGKAEFVGTLFLAADGAELFLLFAKNLHVFLSQAQGGDEVFFRQFVGGTFNHDHLVLRPGKHQVKLAVFTLGIGRVDDELAVNAAHADGAHGFGKGEVGNDAGGGSAVDAQNVRFIFTVGGKQKGDHLRIIEVGAGGGPSCGTSGFPFPWGGLHA